MKDLHPDRDPRPLTDLLRGSAPDGPDPAGRAAAVVRRSRRARHRQGTISALTVGVVALAVIVTPHLIPGSPVSTTAAGGKADTSQAAARLAHPYTCPTPDRTPPSTWNPGGDEVPAGAILARICPSALLGTPPGDALTTNVNRIAEMFNHLPRPSRRTSCPQQARGDTYTLTFQYRDGRVVTLKAATGGCSFVSMTGNQKASRMGASQLLHTYLTVLAQQRREETPPVETSIGRPSCPARSGSGRASLISSGRALHLRLAVVCRYSPRGALTGSGALSRSQVGALDNDYREKASRHPSVLSCPLTMDDYLVVGRTAWNDQVILSSECGAFTSRNDEPPHLWWLPSASIWRMMWSTLPR
jgi:hypothetical protein